MSTREASGGVLDGWGTGARTVEVETPEQVELAFELADLGSRFQALVADAVILGVLFLGLWAVSLWVSTFVDLPDLAGSVGVAVLGMVVFVVQWGYFVYFEGFRRGRTPGKRWTGIRVVHDGGYPLTLRGAAIRNLVRIVDVQPGVTCVLGGAVMMLNARTKRLGDLAADTIVIRERTHTDLPEAALAGRAATGLPRLDDARFKALDRFVARRGELTPAVQARLAIGVARAVGEDRMAEAPEGLSQVQKLVHLHEQERERRAGGAGSERASILAAALLRERSAAWKEYEDLVARARKRGLSALPDTDVSRFATLYRLVSADLARVRTYRGSGELTYSLERLVTEGHNLFYRPGARSWRALWTWLSVGFPRLVRARRLVVAAAAGALFLPAVASYTAVRLDPAVARQILPAGMIIRAENAPTRLRSGQGYIDVPGVLMPTMSSRIMTNNVQVTLLAFAGGVLAGLGTLVILVFNGLYLGAMLALYDSYGVGRLIWTFVAPHGVVELASICIAGSAGLWLGSGLLFPGRLSRAAALAERARDGVSLLAGTTLLLVLAGSIEGFVSPSDTPEVFRLGTAAGVAVALTAYVVLSGRKGEKEGPTTEAPGTSRPDSD